MLSCIYFGDRYDELEKEEELLRKEEEETERDYELCKIPMQALKTIYSPILKL